MEEVFTKKSTTKDPFFILNVSLLIKFQNLHVKKKCSVESNNRQTACCDSDHESLSDFRASLSNNKLPTLCPKKVLNVKINKK